MVKDNKNTAIYVAYDDHSPHDPVLPEKNLLRAILLTAMNDLQKRGDGAREAIEYFLSAEEDYIFSFRSVCNYLDIDARQVLKVTGLLNSREFLSAHRRSQPRRPYLPPPF